MWDQLFSPPTIFFSVPAFLGTGLFALKLVLMLAGGHHGFDGHDADLGHHGGDAGHHAGDAVDADLHLLTVQGVLAFLMGFGWVGLLVLSSGPAHLYLSLSLAAAAGVGAMYGMAHLMRALMRLQASGTIDAREAVGREGTVYVSIPEADRGAGQVTVIIDDHQRTYNAVSSGPALPRNAKVRILAVRGENTLAVAPA